MTTPQFHDATPRDPAARWPACRYCGEELHRRSPDHAWTHTDSGSVIGTTTTAGYVRRPALADDDRMTVGAAIAFGWFVVLGVVFTVASIVLGLWWL